MAYTAIPDTDIDPDSPVTTGLMTLLRDNPIAIANGDSGAPNIQQAAIAASAVGQAELKTTTGEVTSTSLMYSTTAPGGEYGFYLNAKYSSTASIQSAIAVAVSEQADNSGWTTNLYTTYVARIMLGENSTGTVYARQRYIQASPPYDIGDGEVPLFIFAVIDNGTSDIEAAYSAPEAPWHYNGPTDIRGTGVDKASGNKTRMVSALEYERIANGFDIRQAMASPAGLAQLEALRAMDPVELIIDQAVKNKDMPIIPHPFAGNDLTGKTIVMLDTTLPIMETLHDLHGQGESIAEIVHDYLIIDNVDKPQRARPDPSIVIPNFRWKNNP